MARLQNSINIFYWIQFAVVILSIIYCFTFPTFHVNQAGLSANFLNFKLPFINGLFFYMMLSIGITFSIINQILNKQYYRATFFDGLLIAYVLYNAISLFWVKDFGFGLAATATATSFYITYYLTNDILKKERTFTNNWIKYLIYTLAIAFVLHFFISNLEVLLKFKNTDHSYQKIITQTRSWVGGKNQTACFLALLLPLIVLLKPKNWESAFFISIISIHILIMGSRNAYIALILFFGIYLLFNKIKRKQLVVGVALLVITLFIFGAFVGFDVFINQLKNNTWGSRFIFWQQTLQMGIDYWLGIGAGQWDVYRLQYDVWYTYKHPHNDFIRNFAELGIFGFFLFYSIIGSILLIIFKNLKQHKKCAATALASIVVYLSLSFFDELKMKDNYNILLALIFALINYKLPLFKRQIVNPKFTRLAIISFLCLSTLYLVVYPIKLQNEIQHYKKYRNYYKQKETELAINELKEINETFVSYINGNPVNIIIANSYFNKHNIDSAAVYYAKAAAANPYYIKQVLGGMEVQFVRNKKLNALKQLAKVYLLNPCSAILAEYPMDIFTIKRSKHYKNIIKTQEAKCVKP